ncbi:MAG: HisA/HisF-related TIM barrel protein [Ignisphaera sp.]
MLLEIVPVIDIMNGVVVHAVAGRREEYKPLSKSVVASSPNPIDVLNGFKKLGCRGVYIADLDAIIGRGSNEGVLDAALNLSFKVFADIGRNGIAKKDNNNIVYVIGTEYLVYPNELDVLSGRAISLDMKSNVVMFKNKQIDVVKAANEVCNRNTKMVIALFLDRVGTARGFDVETLKNIIDICKDVDIGVGGGLRDLNDIILLKKLGVKYAFVATAIHRGLIDRCEY